jgi:hypothetical protein
MTKCDKVVMDYLEATEVGKFPPNRVEEQCSQPSRPSGIGQDGDGRQESVRPRAGRRSLSAHNKNYKKIISITILTVMQDL